MASIQRLRRGDPTYPLCFEDCASPPAKLELRGQWHLAARRLAVVGARAASGQAMDRARQVTRELGRAGVQLISGGALGIDGAGHRGALDAGAHTIAILGSGLGDLYPRRHRRLFEGIVDAGGALASPFEHDAPPRRSHFVQRNWLIAAAAQIVWVVEARVASGSLHTARFARRMRRRVAAMPGSPGCDALIARGVPAASTADELIAVARGEHSVQERQLELGIAERTLLEELEGKGSIRPVGRARGPWVELELRGLVHGDGGDGYRLSALAIRALARDS